MNADNHKKTIDFVRWMIIFASIGFAYSPPITNFATLFILGALFFVPDLKKRFAST